ncbi:MAG: tRNA (5-methylaminomethyl-2-thiouridine)(34)-methyltransferase MnmD, partial [Wenzhouxiangellaceae bacterium]|nr:tRNA (5-methylaminomethyl-2-thiouridine)(34)-methyltransferase MnmD [Wenzhouxiangellaceae bacterium]
MQPDFDPIQPAVVDWQGATPVATAFADGYFGREDGPAESRAVFIDGNHLGRRFAELAPGDLFVIGETGFGTGLNLLLAARMFARAAPATARLSLLSAELHPLMPDDLARASESWPALAPLAARLCEQYPALTPGFHRLHLADNIDLTLMFGDAEQMWQHQPARVDAWFLDGFAPDRNPALWHPRLLALLARRSRPGATLATFSAAGHVRRGLADAGFEVRRLPGFGRKRHRVEGRMPGAWRPGRYRTGEALVVGAGLAGATTARALAERGWQVRVADPAGIAAGASGNRAGVVYTTPSGVATPQNRFYQASYLHAIGWFRRYLAERAGIGRFNGVVQHVTHANQRAKLLKAAASGHWPDAQMRFIEDDAVLLADGGYLQPAKWCALLLDHDRIRLERTRIQRIDATGRPVPDVSEGRRIDATVLCVAGGAREMPGLPELPLREIRGQVTECRATASSRRWRQAQCHDGYLTPAIDGLHCVGATFNLGDPEPAPRTADDAANLDQLAGRLPQCWRELGGADIEVVTQRVAFRCQANDYLF